MSIGRIICFLVFTMVLLASMSGTTGCANIIPPSGGPQDSTPPKLRRVSPPDSSTNVDQTRIVFEFDEYVDLDNPLQNLIVSPLPAIMPNASRKLQTVTVRLKDSLEANTTYTLNFGKAIKDVNEGNVLKDFTYTFTTGSYFDSLRVRGNVTLARTGGIDSTLTIMLHRNPADSAVKTQRPRYIAKTDGRGNFEFRNLPPGRYYIYALEDETGSYQYLNTERLFAFADSAVTVAPGITPTVNLLAYNIEKPVSTDRQSAAGRNRQTEKRLRFTTNLKNDQQDLLDSLIITFETPLARFDSAKARLTRDTLFTPVTNASWRLDTSGRILTLRHAWLENTPYQLILQKDFATDTLGQELLKTDTINFTTNRIADYGKLSIRFRNLDVARNPVLQFVQGEDVLKSYPLTSINFTESMFRPGDYNLRILYDANKNGTWDPGDFFGTKRQPETVKPVHRQITVKVNWENQFEIDINAAPAVNNGRDNRNPSSPSVNPSAPSRTQPPAGRRVNSPLRTIENQ